MSLPRLRLKKNEDRRLRAGHLWVFSNEVDTIRTPLTDFAPGDPVEIRDSSDRLLGTGYVNPRSLIAARLVSRDSSRPLDGELLRDRLGRALRLRRALFAEPYYRLVYGESDGLPGLVVDRFRDVLSVQLTTAGMERLRDDVVAALEALLEPEGILLRNDSAARALEGLERYVDAVSGTVPERVEIVENATRFAVPVREGQKTGWFFDHRFGRARMREYAAGARVLDLFSYVGGWGVQAATAGAEQVLCVDASSLAVQEVARNAALNGVAERVDTVQEEAFEALRRLREAGDRFELVILDPPAFIKRKKDAAAGEQAYRRLNQLALQVLAPGGVLISASCSYHLPRSALPDALQRAARASRRELRILEQLHQAPDHPVHPAIPETDYLKAFIAAAMD